MTTRHIRMAVLLVSLALPAMPCAASAVPLTYACSAPPLQVRFAIVGDRYNGAVTCGNLFLQPDIPTAPIVRWTSAGSGTLYTLLMIDLDGDAHGSWPDPVPPGQNAPVRHWIVANIPGALLRGPGYREPDRGAAGIAVLQPYRSPHIPVVSDRYGVYLYRQDGPVPATPVAEPITNFDHAAFLKANRLTQPVASNYFVVLYTSEPPFSGKPFHGNDVAGTWLQGRGTGTLTPGPRGGN